MRDNCFFKHFEQSRVTKERRRGDEDDSHRNKKVIKRREYKEKAVQTEIIKERMGGNRRSAQKRTKRGRDSESR